MELTHRVVIAVLPVDVAQSLREHLADRADAGAIITEASGTEGNVFLEYRQHRNAGVHLVQDYLIANVDRKTRIPELAAIAQMGTRTLTRAFRASTGLSIAEYRSKLRLEAARALLKNRRVTVRQVAETVGFHDARQLRRVWKNAFGVTPSQTRSLE